MTGENLKGENVGDKKVVNQGDILKVERIGKPILVVSKDYFNQSGEILACPIIENSKDGPLHIWVRTTEIEGFVHCEKLVLLDLKARGYKRIGRILMADIMNISDAIQGIFDYV